jgi:hypothetical protein
MSAGGGSGGRTAHDTAGTSRSPGKVTVSEERNETREYHRSTSSGSSSQTDETSSSSTSSDSRRRHRHRRSSHRHSSRSSQSRRHYEDSSRRDRDGQASDRRTTYHHSSSTGDAIQAVAPPSSLTFQTQPAVLTAPGEAPGAVAPCMARHRTPLDTVQLRLRMQSELARTPPSCRAAARFWCGCPSGDAHQSLHLPPQRRRARANAPPHAALQPLATRRSYRAA